MTDAGVKRLILVKALEAEIQGMIADNKQREAEGLVMAYTGLDFCDTADQIRDIATNKDVEIMDL